jgi:hypothetical protein
VPLGLDHPPLAGDAELGDGPVARRHDGVRRRVDRARVRLEAAGEERIERRVVLERKLDLVQVRPDPAREGGVDARAQSARDGHPRTLPHQE